MWLPVPLQGGKQVKGTGAHSPGVDSQWAVHPRGEWGAWALLEVPLTPCHHPWQHLGCGALMNLLCLLVSQVTQWLCRRRWQLAFIQAETQDKSSQQVCLAGAGGNCQIDQKYQALSSNAARTPDLLGSAEKPVIRIFICWPLIQIKIMSGARFSM